MKTEILQRNLTRNSNNSTVPVVLGSALFWAWGFLCYLSPILIPADTVLSTNVSLEMGYFISGASVVVFAVLVIVVSHFKRIIISRVVFFIAAIMLSLSVFVIAWALSNASLIALVACGIVDGVGGTLLVIAWGARYSLSSRHIRPLVLLSFLVSYLLYFLVSLLPQALALVCVGLFPLISWIIGNIDASMRHEVASEVFPTREKNGTHSSPGELSAGSWELLVLPWRSLSVIIIAAFIGNLVSSLIMGFSYENADFFSYNSVAVCAVIATMALVPVTLKGDAFSAESVYGITVTLSAMGLVALMVFEFAAIPIGGPLLQGSAMFLQALTILIVTQRTQDKGLSPLLSFSIGQGVISGVVFLGNVLGKYISARFGSGLFVLDIVCGLCLLVLFFMLIARVSKAPSLPKFEGEQHKETIAFLVDSTKKAIEANDEGTGTAAEHTSTSVADHLQNRVAAFAKAYNLTQRETEVFGYLVKGRSLPYIADELFVTTGTVKTHTKHIYEKLGVNLRQELLDMFESWT